jgi:pheromone shutdown-related protein TraB
MRIGKRRLLGLSMTEAGNVVRVPLPGRNVYLIGTAHVSQKSVEEVKRVIRELRPDTVCVELDASRHQAMTDPSRFRRLDVTEVLRERKALFLFANLTLSSYQKQLGARLGVKPGAELLAGVETAREIGAELVLADRDIQATLKRCWANLSLLDRGKVALLLVGLFLMRDEIDEEQVEALKERSTMSVKLREFAEYMPRLQVPLIDERDRYLMSSVRDAPGATVVAVVGAGHIDGMLRYVDSEVDRDALSVLPRPSAMSRGFKWVLPLLTVGALVWGVVGPLKPPLPTLLGAWLIPNVAGAMLFCGLAGAKLPSLLVAGLIAPLAALSPSASAGAVAARVDAWLRKPGPDDAQDAVDAVATLRGTYRNPFTRVLLVFMLTNLGAALGAFLGGLWLLDVALRGAQP